MLSRLLPFCLLTLLCVFSAEGVHAQPVVIPGSPSFTDGVRDFAANPVVDLGLASAGSWDAASTGQGVYDADEWAVVFKYTSVTIPAGTEVTFDAHPKNAPVIWLVEGDVTIDGTLNLDGAFGDNGMTSPTRGGPGGFRGGMRSVGPQVPSSAGYGPGGGPTYTDGNSTAFGGSHGTLGVGPGATAYPPSTYGNAQILPLVGGSGGAGSPFSLANGGGGGGAILIVAQGTITVNGTVHARGGGAQFRGGGGAGGAIRVVATTTAGAGTLDTVGGADVLGNGAGGLGRVRVETYNANHTWNTFPGTAPQTPDTPVLVFPDRTKPKVTITGISGLPTPLDPSAGTGVPDLSLSGVTDLQITVQTTNADPSATVTVRVTRRVGADLLLTATLDPVGQTGPILNWITEPFTPGQSVGVVQAKVVQP